MRCFSLGFSCLALLACDKPSPPTEAAPTREPVSSASAAPPIASAATAPSVAPVVSVAAEAPSAAPRVATTTKTAVVVDAGKAATAPEPAAPAPAPAPAARAASKRFTGNNFALDVSSPGCRAATDCAMTIALVPTGSFHVNKDYPYKFTAVAAPNLTFLGKGDALVFSKATGDFVEQGERSATMTVRFKPAAAGDATVSGTYKFSVCSADQCQLEQQKIDLVVNTL